MALTVTPPPLAAPFLLPPSPSSVTVSATLAANETLQARRLAGQPVLPMAFGEAGLPAHPVLRQALASAAGSTSYGPVAGQDCLRAEAAAYWTRRGLPTEPEAVVCGPGSKALLFGLTLAVGGDIVVPKPSWVSYAAQACLSGGTARFVPGGSGVPDPAELGLVAAQARAAGRPIRAVIVTLPDNPTGTLAAPDAVAALCAVAEEHGLVIISDEIYRDLVYDTGTMVTSPAALCPDRTVVTSGLSKSLALGGWRLGVARLPDGPLGSELRQRLLGIGSEIWSAPSAPIQQAATLAFREPTELTERVALSRRLHGHVARAVALQFAKAGALVPDPQAAFYVYPDFSPLAEALLGRHGLATDADLAAFLLQRHGVGVLPGSAFGDEPGLLRLRVATGMLYGETEAQRCTALTSADPCSLPWIAAALSRLEEVLTDLTC